MSPRSPGAIREDDRIMFDLVSCSLSLFGQIWLDQVELSSAHKRPAKAGKIFGGLSRSAFDFDVQPIRQC